MAIFVSHGNATSKPDSNRISASASATYILYGRRYVMSRRISLESYAFPKTSSSCIAFSLAHSKFFFQQLAPMEFRVIAVARQQFRMSSAFDDFTFIENDDFIRLLDGRNAVADQNRCAVSHHLLQLVKDLFFRVGIDTRQCIVENQDLRIPNYRARNCRSLLLAARQSNTAFANDGLILVGKRLDILVDMGNFRGSLNVRVLSGFHSKGDVLANGLPEKKRVLRNETDRAPQFVKGNSLDRNIIDE